MKNDILLLCDEALTLLSPRTLSFLLNDPASRLLQCYDPTLDTRHPLALYIKAELWRRKNAPPPDPRHRSRRVDLRARGANRCKA
ncbi:MAG: hypothetical protein NT023_05885 [Armatimonadetes bacterium]|nr:hypothetical protein [Armatimonadota bacterium]